MSGIVAIVPLRDGTSGKTRLAKSFSVEDRTRLIAAMARHVVRALAASGKIETILVVTRDPDVVRQALGVDGESVQFSHQSEDVIGLNGALELGRRWAIAEGASGVLIAPADLPLLSAEDVRILVARSDSIVIAPDRRRSGTNALFLPIERTSGPFPSEDHQFVFQFGEGSYAAHIAEGVRLGKDGVTLILDGTELDLDTIDDWQSLPASARAALGIALTNPCELETTQDLYSCVVEPNKRTAMFPWS